MLNRKWNERPRHHLLAALLTVGLALVGAITILAQPVPAMASVSNSQNLPPVYSNWPKNPTNWPCYATPSYACTQGGYNNKSALASGWPNTYYGNGYASTNKYGMHNCTLYAAYRLKENGFKNPGNWGNASNWAKAANADHILVNQTPAVGSIAQWNAGAGGDGHVAYVESVSYNGSGHVTAITITEDNFMPETGQGNLDGGYTAEIHITAGASVWPANFIHAKDQTSSASQLLWKLRNTNGSGAADTAFYYGASTDTPVVGDWDGNRTATAGIVRPDGGQLLWKLRNTNSAGAANSAFDYGASNAPPTPGNWDGIGSTTPGVARTDDGTGQLLWELRNADGPGPATYDFHYGPSNALPVVGDWDGNGTVTIGVVRQDPTTGTLLWELRNSNSPGPADIEFHYGPNNALPVAGDWDGNRTTTIGVVRPINGQLYWELRNSDSAGAADLSFYYGASTDIPVVGDWDGNDTVTVGIVRR